MARTLTKEEIISNPINYIYIFTNDSFYKAVAKYISKSAAATIKRKAENQRIMVRNAYGSTIDFDKYAYNDITQASKDVYGYTPQTILKKLLAGESVAGKNWRNGVFGIGSANRSSYSLNPDITVNDTTGQLMIKGATDEETIRMTQEAQKYATPIYENVNGETKRTGYSYQINGNSFTTKLGEDGKYYAGTCGDKNGMYTADGAKVTAKDFSSVWANVETYASAFQQFIEWLFSLLKNFGLLDKGTTAITRNNTQPSQEEFMTESTSTASIGVIGALLIGGALIMGMPKTGKKNKK